jgi:carbonic anhydrase
VLAQQVESQKVSTPSQDSVWNELSAGNKRFAEGHSRRQNYTAQRQKLTKDQHPKAALLSCSDSRVSPEILFDQGLGDLFVVRTAGNSADPIELGSLEYAVEHLGVNEIVVLGHQNCGAVKAACSGSKMPTANLEALVTPIAESCSVAKQQKPEDVIDFAIKDHVHRSAADLLARSTVLKHASEDGTLRIVEAVYSLDTGMVTRLH